MQMHAHYKPFSVEGINIVSDFKLLIRNRAFTNGMTDRQKF